MRQHIKDGEAKNSEFGDGERGKGGGMTCFHDLQTALKAKTSAAARFDSIKLSKSLGRSDQLVSISLFSYSSSQDDDATLASAMFTY